MTLSESFFHIKSALQSHYSERESHLMADLLLEKISGHLRNEKDPSPLKDEDAPLLYGQLHQLLQYRPIQYVLGEAWFQNMKFAVNESVLIPRPETEELVSWIVSEEKSGKNQTVLDIGSGSGCIPISLAKKLPTALIHSCDISEAALLLARKNANSLGATIQWHLQDFLQEKNWDAFPTPGIVVSNPPYIPQSSRSTMDRHVVDFEPAVALFVPDENTLLFYEAIARFTRERAVPGARVFVETHEELAGAVAHCFSAAGLAETAIKHDMQGKERMVRAVNPL